ncbi:MAG TPA: response regulator [Candidatus Saccharimonadales bacterium]|nr:response regulator [Candidatus Saccharimonadales bacterium]
MQKKILIVEDDSAFYNLCATALQLKGYEVSHVADAALATEQMLQVKPDLVLLDIMLPNKTGLEVLQEMKGNEELRGIKVVMLTNFGTQDNINKAIELGADDYFMKYNIVPSELGEKVGAVLGNNTESAVKVTE